MNDIFYMRKVNVYIKGGGCNDYFGFFIVREGVVYFFFGRFGCG